MLDSLGPDDTKTSDLVLDITESQPADFSQFEKPIIFSNSAASKSVIKTELAQFANGDIDVKALSDRIIPK